MGLPEPTFANAKLAQATAAGLYPAAQSIELVERGYDNIVALVDQAYAVRFPRNANAHARSQYEKHILTELADANILPIPCFIGEHHNPECLVTSFVAGQHLKTDAIRALSEPQQKALGEALAEFAHAMHQHLRVAQELPLREALKLEGPDEAPWPEHFETVILNHSFPTPQQDAAAKQQYAQWNEHYNVAPTTVVHDDLHPDNLLFDEGRLVGVLDFGDTNVGSPEQDFRHLYRLSPTVLQAGITRYNELSGQKLDEAEIISWAIMQELAVYAEYLIEGDTSNQAHVRACKNLNLWLPEGEWPRL